MKLEEALKYRRKGHDIKRPGWRYPLNTVSNWIKVEDIDAEDWEVVRKKVAWPEAWEALKQGKVVTINDPNASIKRIRKTAEWETRAFAIDCWCMDHKGDWGWSLFGTSMPLRWLSRTDFEIVEDE